MLLNEVRDGLNDVSSGSELDGRHRVIVGDVGNQQFWEGIRKEVSSPFLSQENE